MDKNCGNTNFEDFTQNGKDVYVPSKEERQLGDFGYADEDGPRKSGWCGEDVDDVEDATAVEDVDTIESHSDRYARKVTEKDLDDYVDRNGCSYDEAYRHLGVTKNDIEWEPVQPKIEVVNSQPGPSVDLGERATYLNGVLDQYLHASKLEGFANTTTLHHSDSEMREIARKQAEYERHGDEVFYKAFGSAALINAGYDSSVVKADSHKAARDFAIEYTGHENEKKRDALRRYLKKYLK